MKASNRFLNLCVVILWLTGTGKIVLPDASARGIELYAVELDLPFVIDGTVERWPYLEGVPEIEYTFSEEANVIFHPESWKGEEDLAAKICAGWDAQHLYFTFRIRDDRVVFAKALDQLLKSDHVEIWLDTQFDADKEDTKMSADDLQLSIGMTQDGQPIVADWSPRKKRRELLERSVKSAFQKNAAGYTVEVAIPLGLLKLNPVQDRRIGVLLDVSDTDVPNSPRQEKLLSSSQERRFRDPTSFNPLIFTFMVYSNDFEAAVGTEWSNTSTGITPVDARRFLGRFGNQTVSLTLTDFPAHTNVTVFFDLFIMVTWDGNSTGWGPDEWDLSVAGGSTLLHTTFSNFTNQAYPDTYPGGNFPARTGATENNTLGYIGFGRTMDSVYRLSFTFSHSASSLGLNFSASGLQHLADENWGIDNIVINVF